MRLALFALSVAALTACGPGSKFNHPQDHLFVISDWTVPSSSAEASSLAVPVAGTTRRNQLGQALASLVSMRTLLNSTVDAAVATGASIDLLDLQTETPVDERAKLFVLRGSNPNPPACADQNDTVCAKHLAGDASFTAADLPGGRSVFEGSLKSGAVSVAAVSASLPIPLGIPAEMIIPIQQAVVELTWTDPKLENGKFGGAVSATDLDTAVVAPMISLISPIVSRDCTNLGSPPDCGCMASSDGKTLLGELDVAPRDCVITAAELKTGSAWIPDVDLDGDGTPDALSVGFGFQAVGATAAIP